MASLKEVKARINSVSSTRKITSAMRMVSSAKLRKAQRSIENMLPYERALSSILTELLRGVDVSSPFSEVREVKRVAIVVVSSNGSLCGAYNANVIKQFVAVAKEYERLGRENILVYAIGRKIADGVTNEGYLSHGDRSTLADKPTYQQATYLAQELMDLFQRGEIDRVELLYHHFKSAGSQLLTRDVYLPIDLRDSSVGPIGNYIIEPDQKELVRILLPKVLIMKLYTMLLDAVASEHAARMLAMQIASDNADDIISDLTVQYNKSRQQAITNELLDIIGGSFS